MMNNMQSNLATIREDFEMLRPDQQGRSLAYLDSAASSLTPNFVIDAMEEYYALYRANVHRGLYRASERATEEYERARECVKKLIGAATEEVVFTSGTTGGLNMIVRMVEQELSFGDEIVLTVGEHHANLVPWQEVAKRRGAQLRFVRVDQDGRLDMGSFAAALSTRTKVVAFTWVSNVTGVVNPVKDMVRLVREKTSALVVLDAAQAMMHMPVRVRDLDVDFMVFSGHKMFGPTGIGVLYGKRMLLDRFEPVMFGGDMIQEVTLTGSTWAELPKKFEAGTPNISGAIGLGAAVHYLELFDRAQLVEHEQVLTAYALERLRAIDGVRIVGPQDMHDRIGVISFVVEGVHPHDVAAVLDTYRVAVRAGYHCAMPLMDTLRCSTGTVRLSLAPYNSKEDIDVLCQGVRQAQKVLLIGKEQH